MNDGATVVGVVDDETGTALAEGLAAAGLETRVDGGATSSDVDVIVAVGEDAIADVATSGTDAPVLPVDAGRGIRAIPHAAIDRIPAALAAGDWVVERHQPFSVAVDDEPVGTAVFDVTLLTADAARISEYVVCRDGDRLDGARADGVVVATPAGSTDYARRVEAPVLEPGTGVAVAWIAPFRTDPNRWVVAPTSLSIQVERDETAVDLLVDGRVARRVGPDDVVSVEPTDSFDVVVIDVSRNRYDRPAE